MKLKRYILFFILSVCACAGVRAQTDTIRYVNAQYGQYSNDGRSWATATNKLQDAINDLRDYMNRNPSVKRGYVYVAAGTYHPTESTESIGGSMLNTSFKIYGGIYVYGGFSADTAYARLNEPTPGDRMMSNGKRCKENWADPTGIGTTSGTEIASQWDLRNKTVLTGNHTTTPVEFTFDSIRGRYNTVFPANSYHVVWFATNGAYPADNDSLQGHYRPLNDSALVDGCVISSGNASTRNTTYREHTAYGGGVYMVDKAMLKNCLVERCYATMRGGGIYMDGGGKAEFCFVHSCQAAGVGVVEGYGGGVCIDHEGSIGHSHITSCAARCGGGLMINHVPSEYPTVDTLYYLPYATACVINNNTAAAEGGGIYLAEGGTINHCTVTANNCIGPDVTYYGRRHGRSGGIYIRNCGMIFNSVFWGNRCAINNDIQFASVRQDPKPKHEIFVYHSAFMNHDITDWTGVTKEMVFSLDKNNLPIQSAFSANYPCFFTPTVDPTDWSNIDASKGLYGPGVFQHIRLVDIPGPRIWHLTSYSALDQKGVQVTDAVQNVKEWIRHAHTDYGVVSNPYEPASTLGALVRKPDALTYSLIPQQGAEGRQSSELIPTLFIDPNRKGVFDENGKFVLQEREGNSWDTPIKDLGEAISAFRKYLVDEDGGNHHYKMPKLDERGYSVGEDTIYPYVQILVKEGTITTAGPGNYLSRDIRTAATRVESHMRLYGGYPSKLTGTNTSERNPRDYVSNITANITRISGTRGYENNSAHVIAMVNVENSVIDGFTLSDANTHNVGLTGSVQAGAGVLVNNSSTPKEKRINMVGNQLRNSVITNCTAPKGAAVYVNGEFPKGDDSICYAELMMVNCVIRNNKADHKKSGDKVTESHGVITANGRAYIHIEHCDIVNNVGFPFKADSKETNGEGAIYCQHDEHHHASPFHGYIRVDNSIIFCNGDTTVDNRGQLGSVANVTSVNPDGQDYVFGRYNMFDHDLRLHRDSSIHWPRGFFSNDFQVPNFEEVHFMPSGVSSHFVADISDIPADSASRHNQCIFTRLNTSDPNYPTFLNPSRNVGVSINGDRPLYGGKVSYAPQTTNPCVNAAYEDDYTAIDNFDRTDNTPRDQGGAPDIGAVENTDLPANGTVIYVTEHGAGKRDGSSWANAIAGNTVYAMSSVSPAFVRAQGDSIDAANNARLVNATTGDPVLTTDSRYRDGFARSWFTSASIGKVTTTTVTKTWTTETTYYTGGWRDGEIVVNKDNELTVDSIVVVNDPGTTVEGFTPGWNDDTRYPYGEISGASRYQWRSENNYCPVPDNWPQNSVFKSSNTYHGVTGIGNGTRENIILDGNMRLQNDRTENFISGLQWAVEEAARRNHAATRRAGEEFDTIVQVWVGAGTYTDYKGYVMRDSVTVLGGFPIDIYKSPSLSERQALMTAQVNIPKPPQNADLDASKYETILQISDVNPRIDSVTFNEDAVRFTDNDLSRSETTDTKSYIHQNKIIEHYLRYEETLTDSTFVTDTYIEYPNLNNISDNEPYSTLNDTAYFTFGTTSATKDIWHLTIPVANLTWVNPSTSATINGWTCMANRSGGAKIYSTDGSSQIGTTTTGRLWLRDMPWANTTLWQTIPSLPAGRYRLTANMSAFYREDANNSNTGVRFQVIDAQNNVVVNQVLYHKTRVQLRHYEFVFDQPITGTLKIQIVTDDATGTTKANNRREINLTDITLRSYTIGIDYNEYNTVDDPPTDKGDAPPTATTSTNAYTVEKERATIRKHVLQMPDITQPTWSLSRLGAPETLDGNYSGDEYMERVAHTDRLNDPDRTAKGTSSNFSPIIDPNYKRYNESVWDGFTIRHGFIHEYGMNHGGGAGVRIYEGGSLQNCIITDNYYDGRRSKGSGIFCDGASSTIKNCFVLNNSVMGNTQVYAGGLFMYHGTCFNSLFTKNTSKLRGGGVALCVGKFFNNTVVNNYITGSGGEGGGIAISSANSTPSLFVANTIVYDNLKTAISGEGTVLPFMHCYIQSRAEMKSEAVLNAINNGLKNNFLNKTYTSAANNPFAKKLKDAEADNDFALRADGGCVNAGVEDFEGTVAANPSLSSLTSVVAGVELPDNDVVYAKRIQDCQIDIGAYEFNAAYAIRPDTITHPGKAIFYVKFDTYSGDASASSPENAACQQKLQLVLDAAGRYKYNLMTKSAYTQVNAQPVSGQPDSTWIVEVWLAGDSVGSTISDTYYAHYTPTRSTKHSIENYRDNTLDYSFIVPHGVQLKGGYRERYFHFEDESGHVLADTTGQTWHAVDERDPLTYRTVLSGNITSSTGAEGQIFHIVTFTNDLFNIEEEKIIGDGNQLAVLTHEKDRAVIDGLFLEDGYANSPDDEDCIGAGAVVTDYAHVRNCVVQNNEAIGSGGGLYLKPYALVSGTIVKKNKADVGGGIYIESPNQTDTRFVSADSLAHVFATSICENSATTSAGGMWFQNTDARVNSTVIWQNSANDNANVSGSFTRSDTETDYPFRFCAVESRRLEGQGNLEVPPRSTEGVRWDEQDPFHAILYYPIEMSSTLAHAGMTYTDWFNTINRYTTLDTMDIAGVSRTRWTSTGAPRNFAWGSDTLVTKNNDCIEIGARALNKNFAINVNEKYVMRRLYVMNTSLINSEAARALQDNTETDDVSNMYRQMGSCILNPFHRLGDAFDYIIAARKADPKKYRNAVFEVFIEQGTYYPYHNAYGEQGQVRNNTFLVPEGIYVIGGIDSKQDGHQYGQEGYSDIFTGVSLGTGADVPVPGTGYTINFAPLDSIRLRDARHRPMRDINLNSVIEPWEFERQTILSGNAVSGEDFTHVYHVVTMHADSLKVGPQPLKYKHMNPDYGIVPGAPLLIDPLPMDQPDRFKEECDLSILGRTTEFDGISFTGGYANRLDPLDTVNHYYNTKTYYQGGGILVDGKWTQSFDSINCDVPDVTKAAPYNIPIIVENCQFYDNMAGNGGGIYTNGSLYLFGCHFTQNYSRGPMTKFDQQFIPWSAGGCIASNSVCNIANSLFANNEARRGLYPITASGSEVIPDADARQGFGGALSLSQDATLRVANCHFVKNKAVAYSAIYNFLANNHYSTSDSMQFVFNTLFWGNEVFEVDNIGVLENEEAPSQAQIEAFNSKYKDSRKGVFHYDGDIWKRYERLYHEYDSLYNYWTSSERQELKDTFNAQTLAKLEELRQVGDSMEGLYFCSYRKTYGPTGMRPNKDGYLMTEEETRRYIDARQSTVRTKKDANDDIVENLDSLFSWVHGNNNVLINPINSAPDGPNFKQPSFVAGVDGYMQNADWLLARVNLTTDQGWGHLKQNVTRSVSYYITKYTGGEQFDDPASALAAAIANKPDSVASVTMHDVYPISGFPESSFLPESQQVSNKGIYNFYAARFGNFMSRIAPPLPLGDQYYMTFTRSTNDTETSGALDRISKHPKMGESDVYIDMGVYEYQYVQLDIKGQEIDTVWVATRSKGPNQDGITWEAPTTDLQYAIELLMSSHNNHDKYVCFLSDTSHFSPSTIIDNRLSFIVTSSTLAPLLPDSALADVDYAIKSLNFLGGYSYSSKDAARDPYAHPTIIEMPEVGNAKQRNQLFVIEDMTHQLVQANWQGEYISRDSIVIPVTFDGITFINPYSTKDPENTDLGGVMTDKGGAAIYYRWQRYYEQTAGSTPDFKTALSPDSVVIEGHKIAVPKLTITNCSFMDNGARTDSISLRSPAVRIDHGGGSTLIVNSLFHSNAGDPIYAQRYDTVEGVNNLARIPNNVIIVNSTFALNDGHINLESNNSEIHNSIIWMDDLANDTTVQLELNNGYIWGRRENDSIRPGLAERVTNNAFWGCFIDGDTVYHNDNLVSDNMDVFEGPGFLQPFVAATTSDERRERSFRLNPSVRTMNLADTMMYRTRNMYRSPRNDVDLANKPRYYGTDMDRGAYECLAALQRTMYVQPDRPEFDAGDGTSWGKPLGEGQLQNAIDIAAVYTYLSRHADRETKKAYVFVKGSGSNETPLNVVARDGVQIFGSLPSNLTDTAVLNPDSNSFTNGECQRYVNYVRSLSSGVASPDANPTRINTLRVRGDAFTVGFLMDGFVFTGHNDTTASLVLNQDNSSVRNCLFVNNNITGTAPVADIKKGLLYNSLFYNDSASAMVRLGANGLALNNTIVASKANIVPLDTTARAGERAAINNIALNTTVTAPSCFAPYFSQRNAYTLPYYLVHNDALNYQLHERSKQINAGVDDSALPALFDDYKADSIIAFCHDRDVLGNPRRIGGRVDNGALETWRVESNTAVNLTTLTNEITGVRIFSADYPTLRTAFTSHYGGNAYPHPGSVVYLMDSSAMTMGYEYGDFEEMYFRPGYMLLKSGASFFGNGQNVQMNYLAAEKKFINQHYSMTAFPFDYDTANVSATTYDSAIDSLKQVRAHDFNTYIYSGAARSVKDYVFKTDNSSAWLRVDTAHRVATEGYLMDFGATVDTVLRFTAFAPAAGKYVYTEDSEDKMIYLTQYDHREAGTGADLNFTRQEDMGWNMKGLPWLVSDYRTDTILEEGNFLRQMYIPHIFYQMDGAGSYFDAGDQMYTLRSWADGATMSMGNAFFTQTATTKDKETVIFHLPYYGRNEVAGRPLVRLAPSRNTRGLSADMITVIPDSTASKNIRYSYGRDGMKWTTNDSVAQLYMLDSKRLTRISLLGAAPTEVDIPLGVNIPAEDNFIFSLPDKEYYAEYAYVWLIDNKLNRTVNLLEQDYETDIALGQDNTRFALRIGGFPLTNQKGQRKYIVYAYSQTLYVRGLVAGDKIDIYSPTGKKVYSATATAPEWKLPLSYQTGYIVKVNDSPYKVLNL